MIEEKEMHIDALIYREPEFKSTRETTAYHEAGHFVVQYITGLLPKKTEINHNGSRGAATYGVKPSGCSTLLEEMPIEIQREGACLLAAMYQAGSVAERIFTKTVVDGVIISSGTDNEASIKSLKMVGLSPLCKYPDFLAKTILNNQWAMVERVAKKLLKDGLIVWSEEELNALVV